MTYASMKGNKRIAKSNVTKRDVDKKLPYK